MANEILDNMTYEDVETYRPASEIAKRRKESQAEVKGFEKSQRFFDEMRQEQRVANTTANLRSQTAHMKKAIQVKNENFDTKLQNERRLEKLNSKAKNQLVDAQIKFQEDSFGRRYLQERQIQDWYNTKARSEQEWQDFKMKQEMYHTRKLQVLQQSYRVLEKAERQAYAEGKLQEDQKLQERLAIRKKQIEQKIAQEKQDAANRSSLTSGLFTVAGAIVGAFVTKTPAGAAGGAAVGGQVGSQVDRSLNK